MGTDIHGELYQGLDEVTARRREYLHRAYSMLPALDRPRILDVGCGRGGPTLELARLSGGEVTGVDIDAQALRELEARARAEGLSERVRVKHGSMTAMDFAEASFDLIWAEASIHAVGFERALQGLRRFLVDRGFLVVHEMAWLRPDPPAELAAHWRAWFPGIRTVEGYATDIPRHGYAVVGTFALPEDFWLHEYFEPLERRIAKLREKHRGDRAAMQVLDGEHREVRLHKRHAGWYGSAYLVMQVDRAWQAPGTALE
jgi:SAM-dependent methyltransferase